MRGTEENTCAGNVALNSISMTVPQTGHLRHYGFTEGYGVYRVRLDGKTRIYSLYNA